MILINCNLNIVNALYGNTFWKINYIPYSISTIKILIENKEDSNVDIHIKPTNSQNNDVFVVDSMMIEMDFKLSGVVVRKMVCIP